ncbi:MAG: zf-HC2 domain-containing protein [Planctomycetota bacterium]
MKCEEIKILLVDYSYDELTKEESVMIKTHLENCGSCAAELKLLEKTRGALALLSSEAPSLIKSAAAERKRPHLLRLLTVAAAGIAAIIILCLFLPQPGDLRFTPMQELGAAQEVERKNISLTVYNGNFAVVRDARIARNLQPGQTELSFVDVAERIEPRTIKLRSVTATKGVDVISQDFLYDLISAQRLLEKRIGEHIKLALKSGGEEIGELLCASDSEVIIKSDKDGLRTMPFDQINAVSFEGEMAKGMVSRPTLKWLLDVNPTGVGKNELEISYITEGVSWNCDYDLIMSSDKTELLCWLTLTNNCGTSFENAKLKLVAGEVNRVENEELSEKRKEVSDEGDKPQGQLVKEKSFFEYHMYETTRSITIHNNETKQIVMSESAVKDMKKEYDIYVYPYMELDAENVCRNSYVTLLFKNSEENGVGIPLPQGNVRLFVPVDGENLFAKSAYIKHTPKDEDVKLQFGESANIVWRVSAAKTVRHRQFAKGSQTISIRSFSGSDAVVHMKLILGNDWEIVKASHKFEKEDANTVRFDLIIKAGEELNVDYSWEMKW